MDSQSTELKHYSVQEGQELWHPGDTFDNPEGEQAVVELASSAPTADERATAETVLIKRAPAATVTTGPTAVERTTVETVLVKRSAAAAGPAARNDTSAIPEATPVSHKRQTEKGVIVASSDERPVDEAKEYLDDIMKVMSHNVISGLKSTAASSAEQPRGRSATHYDEQQKSHPLMTMINDFKSSDATSAEQRKDRTAERSDAHHKSHPLMNMISGLKPTVVSSTEQPNDRTAAYSEEQHKSHPLMSSSLTSNVATQAGTSKHDVGEGAAGPAQQFEHGQIQLWLQFSGLGVSPQRSNELVNWLAKWTPGQALAPGQRELGAHGVPPTDGSTHSKAASDESLLVARALLGIEEENE